MPIYNACHARVKSVASCVWIKTYVSEKVPLTKAFVRDDFPTALKPRIATLRWTRAGSLLAGGGIVIL